MASAGSSDRTASTNTHTHVKKRDILRIDCFICDLVFVLERAGIPRRLTIVLAR
jgi:hypothetical protein